MPVHETSSIRIGVDSPPLPPAYGWHTSGHLPSMPSGETGGWIGVVQLSQAVRHQGGAR